MREDTRDKAKVIQEGPWSFDKHLVLTQEVDGRTQVNQITFSEALFWVRIHDLPLRARNYSVGKFIGNEIGRVEEIDLEEGEMAWGECMRVRVAIDIMKPLLRGTKLSMGEGDSI